MLIPRISLTQGKIGEPNPLTNLTGRIGQGSQGLSDGSQIFDKTEGERPDGRGGNQSQEGTVQTLCNGEVHQMGDRMEVQTSNHGGGERLYYEENVHIYNFGNIQQICSAENALKCNDDEVYKMYKDSIMKTCSDGKVQKVCNEGYMQSYSDNVQKVYSEGYLQSYSDNVQNVYNEGYMQSYSDRDVQKVYYQGNVQIFSAGNVPKLCNEGSAPSSYPILSTEINSSIHDHTMLPLRTITEKGDAEDRNVSSLYSTAQLPLKDTYEKSDTYDKSESNQHSNATLPLPDISQNVDAADKSEVSQNNSEMTLKASIEKNGPIDESDSHHINFKLPVKDFSSNNYGESDSNIESKHLSGIQKHPYTVDSNVSSISVSLTKSVVDSKEMALGSVDFSDKTQNSCPNGTNGGYSEDLGLNQTSIEFSQNTKASSFLKSVNKTAVTLNKTKPFKVNIKALTRQLKAATASVVSAKSKSNTSKVISKFSKEVTTGACCKSPKDVKRHRKEAESNKSCVSFSIRENALLKPMQLLNRKDDGLLDLDLPYSKETNNSQLHELRIEIEKEKKLVAEIAKAHREFSEKHMFRERYRRMRRKVYSEDEFQTDLSSTSGEHSDNININRSTRDSSKKLKPKLSSDSKRSHAKGSLKTKTGDRSKMKHEKMSRKNIKDREKSTKHDNPLTDCGVKRKKETEKVDHIDTDYYEECLESWAVGLENQVNKSKDMESQPQNKCFSFSEKINESRENQNYEINTGQQESTFSSVFERIKANKIDNQYNTNTNSQQQSKCSSLLERIQANDKLRNAYETVLTEEEKNLTEPHQISSKKSSSKSNPKMFDSTRYELDSQHPHRLVIYSSSSESLNTTKNICDSNLSQDIIQKHQSRSSVRKRHNQSRSSNSSCTRPCYIYKNSRSTSRERIRGNRSRTRDSINSRSTSTDTSRESPMSKQRNRKTWSGAKHRRRETRSSSKQSSRDTRSRSSQVTRSGLRQRYRETRSRSRQRSREARSSSNRETRSRSSQGTRSGSSRGTRSGSSRETRSGSSRETRSRSSRETRSRSSRGNRSGSSRGNRSGSSRGTRSGSSRGTRSESSRSWSRQRSQKVQSKFKQKSRETSSRSSGEAPSRSSQETQSRSSRETRLRQRNRDSRSRSRQRSQETRSGSSRGNRSGSSRGTRSGSSRETRSWSSLGNRSGSSRETRSGSSQETHSELSRSRSRQRSRKVRSKFKQKRRETSSRSSGEAPSRSSRETHSGSSQETQSKSSQETRLRQKSRESRSRSRQRSRKAGTRSSRETRSRSSRESRSMTRQRSRKAGTRSSRETRSRSSRESRSRSSRESRSMTRQRSRKAGTRSSRETRSRSSRESRSMTRQRSRKTGTRSSRETRSRSSRESRSRSSRESRSMTRQRSRKAGTRSSRETRSRSSRESRSRSSRESRSMTRQRSRKAGSRSSRETRSRSSRETRSRSSRETRSRSSRETRSRSSRETRSRSSRETRSRSRKTSQESCSRSRQKSRETRSRSRRRSCETRTRSRQTSRETCSRSRQTSRETHSRSRQTSRETRSRSRQTSQEIRSRSRQTSRETHSRSRQTSRETRSRSRQTSRETRSRSRQTSQEIRSRSRQMTREIRSRSRQTSPETRSMLRERNQEIHSRSKHRHRGTWSRSKHRSRDSDFRSGSSSSDRTLGKLRPAFMDLVDPVHKSINNRLRSRERSRTRSHSRNSWTSINDLPSCVETIQGKDLNSQKKEKRRKKKVKKSKEKRKRYRKSSIGSVKLKQEENCSTKEMLSTYTFDKENSTEEEKDCKENKVIVISSNSSSSDENIEKTNKQRKLKRKKIRNSPAKVGNGEILQMSCQRSPVGTFFSRKVYMTTVHPVTNALPVRQTSEKDSETSDELKKDTNDSYSRQHTHQRYMSVGSLQMESLSESEENIRQDSRKLKNLVLDKIYRRYITESSDIPRKITEPDKELCSESEKESHTLSTTKQTDSAGRSNFIGEQSTGDCIMHEGDRTGNVHEDETLGLYEIGNGLSDSRNSSNSGEISDSGVANLVDIAEGEYDNSLVQSCRVDSSTNEGEKSDPKTTSLKEDAKDGSKESTDSARGADIAKQIEKSSQRVTALQNSNQQVSSENETVTSSATPFEENEMLQTDVICIENLDKGTPLQDKSDSESVESFLLFDVDDELISEQVIQEGKRRTSALVDGDKTQELVSISENEMNENGNVCHETVELCYMPDDTEETEEIQCNQVTSEETESLERPQFNNSRHRQEWTSNIAESVKLKGRISASTVTAVRKQTDGKQKGASSKPSESPTSIPSLEKETPDTSSHAAKRSQKSKVSMKCVENNVINYLTNICPECQSVLVLDEFTSVNLKTGDIKMKCQQCLMYTFMKGALALSARNLSTKGLEMNSKNRVELSSDNNRDHDKENRANMKSQGPKRKSKITPPSNSKKKKPRKASVEEKLKALNNKDKSPRKTKGKYPVLRRRKARKTAEVGLQATQPQLSQEKPAVGSLKRGASTEAGNSAKRSNTQIDEGI
ncbi:serine-rich adhesin for platelets isoform X2 [Penaeus vannamei]|uniref:serine-rich adhesin for platelets isoform X2 n=1 Tax=Penaeus vannamei TaxID=6689 RepID=UPI00387F9715